MKPLSHYKKNEFPKEDMVKTTVHIEKRQKDFIDLGNLNLSDMVRDMLDDKMKESQNETIKKAK